MAQDPCFAPTNSVEKLLEEGIDCYSDSFLSAFKIATVYVWAETDNAASGGTNLKMRVSQADNGDELVWVFTSREAFSFFLSQRNLPQFDVIEMTGAELIKEVGATHDILLNIGHAVSPFFPKGSTV